MKNKIEIINNSVNYYGYDLTKLAKTYGTPLKIAFLDAVKDQVLTLKNAFAQTIQNKGYPGRFIYLNANKANYSAEIMMEAAKNGDGFETSSYMDLSLTEQILNFAKFKNKQIYCNGYKDNDYINKIIELCNKDYDITDVLDSYEEFQRLKQSGNLKKQLKVGIRIHLKELYTEKEQELDDRFGLTTEELTKLKKEIKNDNRFVLTTIHFHQRGIDYDNAKFFENFKKAFIEYYVSFKKEFPTITNFDIGGGSPSSVDKENDYSDWADEIITVLQKECAKANIEVPNLIVENGRYSVQKCGVTICRVEGTKKMGNNNWYILNTSLFTIIPEYYECGEKMLFLPLNLNENKMIRAKLAGMTCDKDDVFYYSKGYITMPQKSEKEELFVGVIGSGSYQDSYSGRGGTPLPYSRRKTHNCIF